VQPELGRSRYSIESLREIARSRGGDCLSEECRTSKSRVQFVCANGHVWDTLAEVVVRQGSWCARCARSASIEDMRELARERGGFCLSPAYGGALGKLEWQCEAGHRFWTTPNTVKGGSWCPRCRLGMGSIEEMQAIARERGGACLSRDYVSQDDKLRWRCRLGHEWEATPRHVKKSRSWCPRCAGKAVTIADMGALAAAYRGECLSTEYVNSHLPLRWRCGEGHEFEKTPASIKGWNAWCPACSRRQPVTAARLRDAAAEYGGRWLGPSAARGYQRWECAEGHRWEAQHMHVLHSKSWCPECAGNAKMTIEHMQAIAKKRGGVCLSKKYVKSRARLRWQCARGHRFEATPMAVVHDGRWCLVCKREGLARRSRSKSRR
jgi:hypothetical protein